MNAKKRYTKNTGAFTLVELIIVITILAILATIAFVSFQGYSRDARNSKRDAEISQLQKLIEVKAANGVNYLDMITQSTGSMMTQAANFNLAGYVKADINTGGLAGVYKAGVPNNGVLGVSEGTFKDPLTGDMYRIGVSSIGKGKFQIATIREKDGNMKVPYVVGTYSPRTSRDIAISNVSVANSTTVFKISNDADIGFFQEKDQITLATGSTTCTGVVQEISSDLRTVRISNTCNGAFGVARLGTTTGYSESVGLIRSVDGNNPVVDQGTNLPY